MKDLENNELNNGEKCTNEQIDIDLKRRCEACEQHICNNMLLFDGSFY